jgi:hypothetical protein
MSVLTFEKGIKSPGAKTVFASNDEKVQTSREWHTSSRILIIPNTKRDTLCFKKIMEVATIPPNSIHQSMNLAASCSAGYPNLKSALGQSVPTVVLYRHDTVSK